MKNESTDLMNSPQVTSRELKSMSDDMKIIKRFRIKSTKANSFKKQTIKY